jgi:hypothetical protein
VGRGGRHERPSGSTDFHLTLMPPQERFQAAKTRPWPFSRRPL